MALPGAVEYQNLHRDGSPPDVGMQIGASDNFSACEVMLSSVQELHVLCRWGRVSIGARNWQPTSTFLSTLHLLEDVKEGKAPGELSLYSLRAISEQLPPSGASLLLALSISLGSGSLDKLGIGCLCIYMAAAAAAPGLSAS
eukprot:SAG11_NODE_3032_length_2749_cov_8.088679_3_plen_142_part_00